MEHGNILCGLKAGTAVRKAAARLGRDYASPKRARGRAQHRARCETNRSAFINAAHAARMTLTRRAEMALRAAEFDAFG